MIRSRPWCQNAPSTRLSVLSPSLPPRGRRSSRLPYPTKERGGAGQRLLVGTFISTLDAFAGIVAYLLWCGKVRLPGSLREGILPRPAVGALPAGLGGYPRHRVDDHGSPDGDRRRLIAHPGDDRPLGSALRSHGLRRLQRQPGMNYRYPFVADLIGGSRRSGTTL